MIKVFQCQECGEKFEKNVLSRDDRQEAMMRGKSFGPVVCPNCHSRNIVEI